MSFVRKAIRTGVLISLAGQFRPALSQWTDGKNGVESQLKIWIHYITATKRDTHRGPRPPMWASGLWARTRHLSKSFIIYLRCTRPEGTNTVSGYPRETTPPPSLSLLWPEDNATAHPATHPAIHPARFFSMRGRKCVSVKSSLQLHLWSLDLITTAASDYRRLQRLQPCENVSSPAGASLARTLRGRVQHKIGAVCNRQIKTSTKNDNNKRGNRKVSVWTSGKKKRKKELTPPLWSGAKAPWRSVPPISTHPWETPGRKKRTSRYPVHKLGVGRGKGRVPLNGADQKERRNKNLKSRHALQVVVRHPLPRSARVETKFGQPPVISS